MTDDDERSGHGFVSPEAVRLDLPVAGPAPRIFAYAIDAVLLWIIVLVLVFTAFLALPLAQVLREWLDPLLRDLREGGSTGKEVEIFGPAVAVMFAVLILVQFVVETGYFIFWEAATGGQSPGKKLIGLRVVRRGGQPLDLQSSMIRNLLRVADMLPANYVVGLLSMLLSAGGERLGDHAAGTLVIRLDRPEAAPPIHLPDDLGPLPLTREQLARLGPREVRLIRATLRRLPSLSEERRRELLFQVSESIRQRIGLEEIAEHARDRFLLRLLAAAERSR